MKSVYNFVVKPAGGRYNNTKKVGDSELILNTEIFNHQYTNRIAKVISTPIIGNTDIKPGDEIIVHHNIFRRWHDIKGVERNSASYFDENTYIIYEDQIFAYKRDDIWKPLKGFCFIQPLKETNILYTDKEKLMGIVVYSDGTVDEGDLVRFKAKGKYEFIINNQRLYRVKSNFITIKYEHQGNEEKYNPSWAESSRRAD
tara:strand:+ start:130 stop:729 length:600 start_codon:yes stop_codon:yes gene_type:complete